MPLSITAEWERLEAGPPEERACFAAIGILANDKSLSEAEDSFVKRLRTSVHLSAYRLAEWFAWNWWRQRWEPRSNSRDWAMAHRMTTIGGGFVWPNITIISDGERIVLVAKATELRAAEPIRYLSNTAAVFRVVEFERAVSQFIEQVQGQLRAEKVAATNLDSVWADVCEERADVATAKRRKLEALLGFDPDEAEVTLLEDLVAQEADLGESAIGEMAAMSPQAQTIITPDRLQSIANDVGFQARPRDVIQLRKRAELPRIGDVPAWERGAIAARQLREQEQLGAAPISNDRLATMSGVGHSTLTDNRRSAPELSFAIDDSPTGGRVVLRSRWETGRRFELARLLGDRIASGVGGRLFPATRTFTYRQKLQRSFAAELLSPFEAVADMLSGDYSAEKQEEAALHFNVSALTVRTLLMNHGLVGRDDLDGEFESAVVA